MTTIHITTNYNCQEISTPHCTELYGGGLWSIYESTVKAVKLIFEGVKLIDEFFSDIGPSFIEGFKEGWESTR